MQIQHEYRGCMHDIHTNSPFSVTQKCSRELFMVTCAGSCFLEALLINGCVWLNTMNVHYQWSSLQKVIWSYRGQRCLKMFLTCLSTSVAELGIRQSWLWSCWVMGCCLAQGWTQLEGGEPRVEMVFLSLIICWTFAVFVLLIGKVRRVVAS